MAGDSRPAGAQRDDRGLRVVRWGLETPLDAPEGFMNIQALFGLSVFMSFVAFGLVTHLYVWPRLRILERDNALISLVVPHTFRFIGLSFLVPGVVSPSLPSAIAAPAAYGDLVAAILAVATTIALEAPTLRRTFGAEYEAFCANVPRWVPRLSPWSGDTRQDRDC
jgi:protein-S-isoprenylcysteine O-methyltransferase Ste14